jgi:COMPASS component SWD2
MHDNKYLLYLKGHTARWVAPTKGETRLTGRVRSLQMHPTDDKFISAGDDGTVRIWDLRMQKCQVGL